MEKSNGKEWSERIEIVLVETQDGANIGSVCRAMKTRGLVNHKAEREVQEDELLLPRAAGRKDFIPS